jgi:hypothetical protein
MKIESPVPNAHPRIGFRHFSLFILSLIIISPSLVLASTDPCLTYKANTFHCIECDDYYYLTLVNETTTLCASYYDYEYLDGYDSYYGYDLCILDDSWYSNYDAYESEFIMLWGNSYIFCLNCTIYYD